MLETTLDGVVRCAQWSEAHHVDPVGTAGSYAGYVLVEWSLPWPRDVADVEALGRIRNAAAGVGFRIQLMVPADDQSRRIAVYERPGGPFTKFRGRELRVPVERSSGGKDHMQAAFHGPDIDGAATGDSLGRAVEHLIGGGGEPIVQADILVCTHGRRDRCCGSLGTALWQSLGARDGDPRGPGDGARLARTSHTGGHRFAPTCLVLPTGTLWARLDGDALHRIARRAGPLDDLLPRYRGCSGLDSPAAQSLERAVLAEVGWPLFDLGRRVDDLGGGRLRLTVSGHLSTTVWEGSVVPGRTLRVPDCGEPAELSKKTETELRVVDLSIVE